MNFSEKGLSVEQTKAIDMVSYLSNLGFEPTKIVHDDYWYLSPLRNENTASFKINRRLNRWYDHGMGKGGNLIDFGLLYFNCSFGEFLKQYVGNLAKQPKEIPLQYSSKERQSKIIIQKSQSLQSPSLLGYLKQRKIPLQIARDFCTEVHYSINEHSYYGIGFKNDLGGFEIRNPYFKLSSFPKSITTYEHNSSEVLVFEGFMDYLSYKTINRDLRDNKQNFVILNSLSFLEKARPFIEKHQLARLYLDRDQAGENATKLAISWNGKYKDESTLYRDCKDLNDWVISLKANDSKKIRTNLRP